MPSRSWRRVMLFRLHIHGHHDFVVAPTQDDAAHGTNVSVIPAPGEGNVTLERNHIVSRIDVQPTGAGAIGGHPGMRSIRADQPGASGGRKGSQVSAHVAG